MKQRYLFLLVAILGVLICIPADTQAQNSTASANVQVLSNSFYMPQLNRNRKIWIYLPPDYITSNKSYPVIYMHDAQDLFDDSLAFGSTEWQVDETLNILFASGDRGCIVVGIENSSMRINEYSPWVNSVAMNTAEGDAYVQFIINTLKPYVDANFRTLPGRIHTGILGSSLGGLLSLYGAISNQNVFAKVGALSPSISFSEGQMLNTISLYSRQAYMRIYLSSGSSEPPSMSADLFDVLSHLVSNGFPLNNEVIKETLPGGGHNAASWRQVFPDCYQWLLMNEGNLSGIDDQYEALDLLIYPNPADQEMKIKISDPEHKLSVSVYHVSGAMVHQTELIREKDKEDFALKTAHLVPGIYLIKLVTEKNTSTRKLIVNH